MDVKLALASVVNIEESSYRRIGARMLVSSDGTWEGGISGGCLEGDALKQAQKAIFSNKASIVVYDTLEEEDHNIGIGLGCNGKIEVLFTPLENAVFDSIIPNLRQIAKDKDPSILIKVIDAPLSSGFLGMEFLVPHDLPAFDFCHLDSQKLIADIQKTRIKRRPQVIDVVNTQHVPMRILVEYIRPETKLVIIGDNYDVRAMIAIADEMGWEIHLVGRKRKMSKYFFAKAAAIYEYEEVDTIPQDEHTAVVLMTHDFNWDKKVLPQLLEMNLAYVGMLGPKKRWQKMNDELPDYDLSTIEHFHSPIGLDIGGETPEEIALSVAAEVIAAMRNRKGSPLKHRENTINERRK